MPELHDKSGVCTCRSWRSGENNRVWDRCDVLSARQSLLHAVAAVTVTFAEISVAVRVTGFNALVANLPARVLDVALTHVSNVCKRSRDRDTNIDGGSLCHLRITSRTGEHRPTSLSVGAAFSTLGTLLPHVAL
jgi:hypothetical protein